MALSNNEVEYWDLEPDEVTGKMKLVKKTHPLNWVPKFKHKINPVTGQMYSGIEYGPSEVRTGLFDNAGDASAANSGTQGVSRAGWLKQLQNVQKYNTTNELGQTVVNTANLVNSDGTAHKAYQAAPGTRLGNLIQRKRNGETLTAKEETDVRNFWASNPTQGLVSTNALGTNRPGISKGGNSIGRSLA